MGHAPTAPSESRQTARAADAHHGQMDEATAFLATLAVTAPDAPTACAGWSAHSLVAHLAAGAAEMASLTEETLCGRPARATAAFEQREAPFAALDDDTLRGRLVTEALRLDAAAAALEQSGARVRFAGAMLDAAALRLHGRSEAAVHRWDLAGHDDVSRELLAQPALTAHAVETLNAMVAGSSEDVSARARRAGPGRFRATFATPGAPDVVLTVDDGGGRLSLVDPAPRPTARADAATRLLALWGRRPPTTDVEWTDDEGAAARLARFLWGPAAPARSGRRSATPLSETR